MTDSITLTDAQITAMHRSPGVRDALLAYFDRPCDQEASGVVRAILSHVAAPLAVEDSRERCASSDAKDKEIRWALMALYLVGNKLRSIGLAKDDTALINLAAAESTLRAAMAAASGNQRVRYVRVIHDGTTCVVSPQEVESLVDAERPDDYRTQDVYLSKEEHDALPEFDGF